MKYQNTFKRYEYLTGKLQREQKHLKHIDDDIEIGISYYQIIKNLQPINLICIL